MEENKIVTGEVGAVKAPSMFFQMRITFLKAELMVGVASTPDYMMFLLAPEDTERPPEVGVGDLVKEFNELLNKVTGKSGGLDEKDINEKVKGIGSFDKLSICLACAYFKIKKYKDASKENEIEYAFRLDITSKVTQDNPIFEFKSLSIALLNTTDPQILKKMGMDSFEELNGKDAVLKLEGPFPSQQNRVLTDSGLPGYTELEKKLDELEKEVESLQEKALLRDPESSEQEKIRQELNTIAVQEYKKISADLDSLGEAEYTPFLAELRKALEEKKKTQDIPEELPENFGIFEFVRAVKTGIGVLKALGQMMLYYITDGEQEEKRRAALLERAAAEQVRAHAVILGGLLTSMTSSTSEAMITILYEIFINVQEGKRLAEESYQDNSIPAYIRAAKEYVDIAGYGYEGMEDAGDYVSFTRAGFEAVLGAAGLTEEEAGLLAGSFDEDNGLFKLRYGLKAWLGKAENDMEWLVGFAGTEISDNTPSLVADVMQILCDSSYYLHAAGLLKLLLNVAEVRNGFITVAGHSLGGGLTQYSIAANLNGAAARRHLVTGYCFNSAGLTAANMLNIDDGCRRAKGVIRHYVTDRDLVSVFGGLIGKKVALGGHGYGHGLAKVRAALNETPDENAD